MHEKLKYEIKKDTLEITISEDFLLYDNGKLKNALYESANNSSIKKITIDAKNLGQWDSTLVIILFELIKIANSRKISIEQNNFPKGLSSLINLAFAVNRNPPPPEQKSSLSLEAIGAWGYGIYQSFCKGLGFIGQSMKAFWKVIVGKSFMRGIDFSFALEACGLNALPIVSLISFMVGLILAFVGAVQLTSFGAQIYVASLVTIGMTRIMGAIMTGIIMAGRTGASYAAAIGTMQVNEEIDALKTMGINPVDFLVTPRMLALIITMPILTMWSDIMGMLGGGFVGVTMLGIPMQKYYELSVDAISLNNFLVGIFHGFIFGIVIAVCGCYYGINCGRNADSVGVSTTKAVVSAIIWMIIMTGIITVICQELEI